MCLIHYIYIHFFNVILKMYKYPVVSRSESINIPELNRWVLRFQSFQLHGGKQIKGHRYDDKNEVFRLLCPAVSSVTVTSNTFFSKVVWMIF